MTGLEGETAMAEFILLVGWIAFAMLTVAGIAFVLLTKMGKKNDEQK